MTEPAGINAPAVERWLISRIPQAKPPFHYTLIAGGRSNLTYRVDDAAGNTYVLRRPPLGKLPPSSHDVAREYRILKALGPTSVPVPHVVDLCTDPAMNDATFFVMDWVEGTVIDHVSAVEKALPNSEARRAASLSLVDALANMHGLDLGRIGLHGLASHEDYVGRNLERMRNVWEKTKTSDDPLIDSLHARLVACKPPQRHTALIHSDYRFGNVMFSRDYTLIAVLDWELCTIGDALADLGFLLNNWDLPNDPWPDVWSEIAPTRAVGFPSREEIVARYTERTGFIVDSIDYYRAFNYWRIAIIAEGIKRRYAEGVMGSRGENVEILGRRVKDRAKLADYFMTKYER